MSNNNGNGGNGNGNGKPRDPQAPKPDFAANNQARGVERRSNDPYATTRSAAGFVCVGCKIPNGIILQLSHRESQREPVMGGGHRDVDIWRKTGDKYTVRGPSIPLGTVPRFIMAGGYAITSGIPEDFWNEWVKQNADSEIVRNKLIIGYPQLDYLQDECLDNEKRVTGLEPIDPSRLPRGIETAEEQAKRR